MAIDIEEFEPGANAAYVEGKFNAVMARQFMSIDPNTGNFMIPAEKVGGVQRYGRLKIVLVDGLMTLELDGKFYVKNEDETYSEVSA